MQTKKLFPRQTTTIDGRQTIGGRKIRIDFCCLPKEVFFYLFIFFIVFVLNIEVFLIKFS